MTTQVAEPIEIITDIIVDVLKRSREEVVPNASFSNDLSFDSLEQVEFVMAVEEAFGIEVPDEEADQIDTVQQTIDKIEQSLKM